MRLCHDCRKSRLLSVIPTRLTQRVFLRYLWEVNHQTRIVLRTAGAVLAALLTILLIGIAVEFIALRGSTPPILGRDGTAPARSIAVLEQITLGGVPQFVLIRGADSTNPVILFLHGGPGMPVMYLAHSFQHDLELDFVVVHWDRRGAGKSYAAGLSSDSLTLRQTLDDTFELTEHLRRRFKNDRVLLVGHSWGTYLGLLAVHERPSLYSGYVGMGQLSADSARRHVVQRRFLYNMARAHGDTELLQRLFRGVIREEDLFQYGGEVRGATGFGQILMTGIWAPEYDLFDILNVPKGAAMVTRRMKDDVALGTIEDSLRRFEVPLSFFLGRHDYNTPSVLAAEYFERLGAPEKKLVWFESSAHFPFWEEPGKFSVEMRKLKGEIADFWKQRLN